jgi:glycolate oxidase FAD binding subunit
LPETGLHQPRVLPSTPEELAETLRAAASRNETITLGGASSKRLMAGPVAPADIAISTVGMKRVLAYEPRDLTISVEAGIRYTDLTRILAQNRQMVPLDPPFSETATIGGIVNANSSGPRRRLYGTARDLVIGMKFATLEGKLVQSGGMVVKNVAGLDMGKLMIGSFGTLAAVAVVNFKLTPVPVEEATFLLASETLDAAISARDRVLKSQLQPAAIDLLNPPAAAQLGYKGFVLALRVGGNVAVIDRCRRDFASPGSFTLEGSEEARFWSHVQNYTQQFLEKFTHGTIVRISSTLAQLKDVMASLETAAIARAGSGVCYGFFNRGETAARWVDAAAKRGLTAVIEFAPEQQKASLDLWPSPGTDFEMMRKVKQMFDPNRLLNRGRLYNLI